MKHIENDFFVLNHWNSDTGAYYCDLSRKAPILPGAESELLGVLAPFLVNQPVHEAPLCMIRPGDSYLSDDLQSLGFALTGFLVRKEPGTKWRLWGTYEEAVLIDLSEFKLGTFEIRDAIRLVYTAPSTICHRPQSHSKEYFSFCRQRESYFLGLSHTDYTPSEVPNSGRNADEPAAKTITNDFNKVLATRMSASRLDTGGEIDKLELLSILSQTCGVRPDGHYPYGTPGGFDMLRVLCSHEGIRGLADGISEFNTEHHDLNQKTGGGFSDLIWKAGFSQSPFEGCQVWIGVVIDFSTAEFKYGRRAYRFGLLASGALLQNMHLTCTARGRRFRLMGGYDDKIMSRLFGVDDTSGNLMLCCLAGLA
jgi:SagB-type dehydrogenase family enzyme